MKMLTKFTLIIHCFTGASFVESGRLCYHSMKRHFVNGFITDAVSNNVITLGSFVFSLAVTFTAWAWLDGEYGWHTLRLCSDDESRDESTYGDDDEDRQCDGAMTLFIIWLFFIAFNIYYPVLGIFLLVILDQLIRMFTSESFECDPIYSDADCDDQHRESTSWVPPLAAAFVGCICRLFFNYMGGIILDTIDVCFVCWAIDKDNNVDLSESEFAKLASDLPGVVKIDSASGTVPDGLEMAPMGQSQPQPMVMAQAQPMVPQGMVFVANGGGQQMPLQGQQMQMQMQMPMQGQPMLTQGQPMPMQGQPMLMQGAVGIGVPMQMDPQQQQPMMTMMVPPGQDQKVVLL